MEPYQVPAGGSQLKLDANENPYGLVDELAAQLLEEAAYLDPSRYPDPEAEQVREALSRYTGLAEGCLLVGNGADELIQLVMMSLRDQVTRVVVPVPTFGMYRVAANMMGLELQEIPLTADFALDAAAVVSELDEQTAVVLCLPNNPTGNYFDSRAVTQILETGVHTVVIDEAYFEYCGRTLIGLVVDDSRVVVLRTLSKAFGLAGLRVGYLAAHHKTAKRLRYFKPPYNVSSFSQLAARIVLEHAGKQLSTVALLKTERERLRRDVNSVEGLVALPSEANFLLTRVDCAEFGMRAAQLWARLKRQGIAVRYYSDGPRLTDYLRISVGTPEENQRLVEVVKELQPAGEGSEG